MGRVVEGLGLPPLLALHETFLAPGVVGHNPGAALFGTGDPLGGQKYRIDPEPGKFGLQWQPAWLGPAIV
jgi:hypothetical protein